MKKHYIFVRGLKKVNYSVFCVDETQKIYYDKSTNTYNAYSSGQQVKRSIKDSFLENLNTSRAPLTFDFEIDGEKIKQKEVTQPCDPTYPDQLVCGWMSTPAKGSSDDKFSYTHRSPLSISAMTPLHPYLTTINTEKIITFDRSESDVEVIRVREKISNEKYNYLTEEEIKNFMNKNNASISKRKIAGNDEKRANGLYSFDVAIDLKNLFTVPLTLHDKNMSDETIEKLKQNGWNEKEDFMGKFLELPKQYHKLYAEAIADAIVNWKITSNQSRTFDTMPIVAVAVSTNANEIPNAIMGEIIEDQITKDGKIMQKARLVIDNDYPNTNVYAMPVLKSIVLNNNITIETSKTAINDAKQDIENKILQYYQN